MNYSVKIYSRIGELIQGFLPDASSFLVSGLPSRLFFSEAAVGGATPGAAPPGGISGVAPSGAMPGAVPSGGISGIVTPGGPSEAGSLPPKAQRALSLFLRQYAPAGMALPPIRLHSNIPPGKGLSSSSADILSVLYVANDYLQAGASSEDLYRIAAAVEPTDPCLSEDIVLFRQQVGFVERCISLPPMTILYFDAEPGRQIETMDIERSWTPGVGKYFDWLLRKFLLAAKIGDYDALFGSITDSAEYNQTVIALPRFDEYCQLARGTGSGLMVAHSGTIVGLLTRPEQAAELRGRLNGAMNETIYLENHIPCL
jgi:uncharacterized protein involved in propanediol utilization